MVAFPWVPIYLHHIQFKMQISGGLIALDVHSDANSQYD